MKNLNRVKSVSQVFALFISLAALSSGCSPKVYVIDNQTVLEEEAAGSWPQFEKQILDKAKAKGPTPLSQVPPNQSRDRLYNVLNGEMPVTATDPVASAPKTASANGAIPKAVIPKTGKSATRPDAVNSDAGVAK